MAQLKALQLRTNPHFLFIAPRLEGGQVRISVRSEGEAIVLQVQDDGPGSSDRQGTGTSFGDLERRLELAYGREASIERRFDAQGHCVCIRLPKTRHLEWP